jgi:1-acyl-sn-glycerol-3-phosphate acyltransferase
MFYKTLLKYKKQILKPEILRDKARMDALQRMAKSLVRQTRKSGRQTLAYEVHDGRSPARLAVLERIAEFEEQGIFDANVENDPLYKPRNLSRFDFLKKNFFNRLKAKIAYKQGIKFFEAMLAAKDVVFAGVTGEENVIPGGAVLTCNHIHPIDNYLIHRCFEKTHGKKVLKVWKVIAETNLAFKGKLGFLFRNAYTLPVSQTNLRLTAECVKAVRTLVNSGEKVLIYPEQSMWWQYRKARPCKEGAFLMAAKAESPIIPCFITMKDAGFIGKDGFPVQEMTLHVLPRIDFNPNQSQKENIERMRKENEKAWKDVCEKVYGKAEAEREFGPSPKAAKGK